MKMTLQGLLDLNDIKNKYIGSIFSALLVFHGFVSAIAIAGGYGLRMDLCEIARRLYEKGL
jgi:hypothetical protein